MFSAINVIEQLVRSRRFRRIRHYRKFSWREKLNTYYLIHFTYITIVMFIGAGLGCAIEPDISFIDSLYISASAVCECGLTSDNFTALNIPFQVLQFLLIIAGNQILGSTVPLLYRIFFLLLPKIRRLKRQHEDSEQVRFLQLQVRAAVYLLIVINLYFWFWFLLGTAILLTCGLDGKYDWAIHHSSETDYSNFWFSTFHVASGFLNCGIALLPDSFISLQTRFVPLMTLCVLILVGNTCYPIVLRLVFGALHYLNPQSRALSLIWHRHRLLYAYLFSNYDTIRLLVTVVVLVAAQVGLSAGMDWNREILDGLDWFQKLYNELFVAISTRSAGFNGINIAISSKGVLILYIGCMFIEAFPLTISMRDAGDKKSTAVSEIRKMVLDDLAICFAALLIIGCIETDSLETDPNFSVLAIAFEVVSGYGTVGLSLGCSFFGASLSACFTTASKIVMVFVMLFGRHRGLPKSQDPAIYNILDMYYDREKDKCSGTTYELSDTNSQNSFAGLEMQDVISMVQNDEE